MRTSFLIILAVLVALPAMGQGSIGMTRAKITSSMANYEKMEGDTFEKTKDTGVELCYQTFSHSKQCFYFVGDTCRAEKDINLHNTRERVKEAARAAEDVWEPVKYLADTTEVESIDTAALTADPMAIAVFEPDEDGIALVWSYDTEPKEPGESGGKYTYSRTFIDLSYIDQLPQKNHWK